MMNKIAKVIYFVDALDDTKTTLCVILTSKKVSNPKIIDTIAEKIGEALSFNEIIVANKMNIAIELAQHGMAFCEEYEFGVEEIPILMSLDNVFK